MAGKLARTTSGTAVLPERAYELLDAAVEASTPSVAAAPAVPPSRARAAVARAVATLPSLDVVRAPAQMFVALLATSVLACSQRSAHAFRHHGTWAVITVTSASVCGVRGVCARVLGACALCVGAAKCLAATHARSRA
jgi:hypothetical protein